MTKLLSPLEDAVQAPSACTAELVPLSDAELDAVTGGLLNNNGQVTGQINQAAGLVAGVNALNLGIAVGSVL